MRLGMTHSLSINQEDGMLSTFCKLSINRVSIGTDSSNVVLIEQENSFELHYFGFDFTRKYGSATAPLTVSEQNAPENIDQICQSISKRAEEMISNFIYFQSRHKNKCADQKLRLEEIENFSDLATKHFSNCDFIGKTLLENTHSSAEL